MSLTDMRRRNADRRQRGLASMDPQRLRQLGRELELLIDNLVTAAFACDSAAVDTTRMVLRRHINDLLAATSPSGSIAGDGGGNSDGR